MGAASPTRGPPLPGRARVFLYLGSTFRAAQPRCPSLAPASSVCEGRRWGFREAVLRCLPGPAACLLSPVEAAWIRPPWGRPGPDDRPVGPFEQLVQLSLLAFSPSEVGGALIFKDQRHHSGEKMTNR